MSAEPAVVVGGGHNGLVPAWHLAKAGRRVLVLEAADKPWWSRPDASRTGLAAYVVVRRRICD